MGFERKLTDISNQLSEISQKIKDKVNIIATTTNTDHNYWTKISESLRKDFEDLRGTYAEWIEANLPDIYNDALSGAIKDIKRIGIKGLDNIKYNTLVNSSRSKSDIQILLEDSLNSMYLGLDGGEKTLNKLLRLTQQKLIDESKVNELIEKGFLEGGESLITGDLVGEGSIYGIRRKLQNELLKQMNEEKFVEVININGEIMRFDPAYYAEMVARTKFIESTSYATVNVAKEVNSDLVQVSSHNADDCEICGEYEGNIYSISGTDPDYPPLEEVPPYHPNCRHVITVYIKEIEEVRAEMEVV